jgi:flagellar protein FliL
MAEKQAEEDLDLGEEKPGASKGKLMIIIGAAVLVLALGGGAAWFFMSGDEEAGAETAESEQADGDKKDAEEEKEEEKEKGPAMYHSLSPVFVANLPPGSGAKMLQVGVDVMMRSPELLDFIKLNDPMIRHKLLDLFSTQDAKALRKRDGKEKLQAEALEMIQKIVKEQDGPGKVEALYFTSFVMQ